MEDWDSTGILPVECHKSQDLMSLHFICLRKVGIGCVTSLENRPAGLSRPAPARCDGPGVAIITSDVLVPVIGRARGGLGFGWVTRFVWVQCTPSQSRPGVNWLPGRGPGGAVCTQGLSRAAALHRRDDWVCGSKHCSMASLDISEILESMRGPGPVSHDRHVVTVAVPAPDVWHQPQGDAL